MVPVPVRRVVAAPCGASLAFAATHSLLPTGGFHYIGFITRLFLTSVPIPTLSPQSQAEGLGLGGRAMVHCGQTSGSGERAEMGD